MAKTLVRADARPICDGAPKERKQNAAHMGGILINPADRSALAELRRATGSLEAVFQSSER